MLHADMLEIVQFLRSNAPRDNLRKLLREHTQDASGHCPRCQTVGSCTLGTAAEHALRIGR